MSIDSTSLAKLTKEEILADMIQRELRQSAVLWPRMMDLSSRLSKGQKTTTIPRSTAKSVGDTPSNGTELADASSTYENDTLTLDQFKTVHDYIYDTHDMHSVIDLKNDFYEEAVPSLAEYIEAAAMAKLVADGTTKPSGAANSNKFQLAGSTDGGVTQDELTLDQVGEIAQAMSEAKISKQGRLLFVSPKQARLLRANEAVRNASAYGNSNSIQNGFVARLEGFDIIESVDLSANEVVACHKDAIAKAVAKAVQVDEQRQSSKKRWFCSVDAVYGMQSLRDGELIFYGNASA